MTETQKKKALVKSLRRLAAPLYPKVDQSDLWSALVAAADEIERHEAFRQEVSDAVEAVLSTLDQLVLDDRGEAALRGVRLVSARFIIAKPDPLVEAIKACDLATLDGIEDAVAHDLRAAIEKRGGKIVWGEG